MDTKQTLLFCTGSLALSLGLAAVLYPYASVSEDTLARARAPQPAEEMQDIDLGKDFGVTPVLELMGYYIDNPPPERSQGVEQAPRRQQFGGC